MKKAKKRREKRICLSCSPFHFPFWDKLFPSLSGCWLFFSLESRCMRSKSHFGLCFYFAFCFVCVGLWVFIEFLWWLGLFYDVFHYGNCKDCFFNFFWRFLLFEFLFVRISLIFLFLGFRFIVTLTNHPQIAGIFNEFNAHLVEKRDFFLLTIASLCIYTFLNC